MKNLIRPSYKARTPIVNDSHFSDGPPRPTIGSTQATFNPGSKSGPFPGSGPPKIIQVPGKRVYAKGLTNKRQTQNI